MQFQSTPPAEARGDTFVEVDRSRLRRFQSTPPAEARGDVPPRRRLALIGTIESFNPLPPPKRGETR